MIDIIKIISCALRGHKYQFERNIYGDEINIRNGKRSEWWCTHCGLYQYRDDLHKVEEPQ